MNIDLRNISDDFESAVNEIKVRHNIATNSKAVEHTALNYLSLVSKVESLERELRDTKYELSNLKYSVKNFKESFKQFMNYGKKDSSS